MDIIILPGLTGTNRLLGEFVSALAAASPGAVRVSVIAYPTDQRLDYAALTARVRALLPSDRPFIIVGESFSGPVALSLAITPPPGLRGTVLVASFARFPSTFSPLLAAAAPLAPVRQLPAAVFSWLLLGRWATRQRRAALKQELARIPASLLRFRAAATLRVDLTARLPEITTPLLYCRATADRLVHRAAGEEIQKTIANATLIDIPGPHFLLQTQAASCAAAVIEFMGRIG
ncbi:MAG: lysophospholipase [Azonexus sp.]|jgi:pimeloyl-ACP methyl ester carboxylesterase|nr:lysophospholipase [Azonexus sp.]